MPRRRAILISVSGIDGSGKTTQIELLDDRVKKEKSKVSIVWSRWRPISSLPLLTLMRWLGYSQTYATSSIGFVETRLSNKRGLSSLWCFLTQLDNLMKTGVKVGVPLLLGRTVICDRYTLDLLVENMADLHDPSSRRRLGHRLLSLLPRPDAALLLEVDPAVAYKRKPDMPTVSHFVERAKLYHEMSGRLRVHRIDGSLPVPVVHEKIWSCVSPTLEY